MENLKTKHYSITVETDGKKPGDMVNVVIRPERPNAKYESVYQLIWFVGDTITDLAKRALAHYQMGTKPESKSKIRHGIIDDMGCHRYTMEPEQLQALYKQIENFVADCTVEEYEEYKWAISGLYELIHKHMKNDIIRK